IYLVLDQDQEQLAEAWRQLDATGALDLSEYQARFQQQFGMVSGTSTHADRVATIRAVHVKSEVVIDPHTADGVTVARGYRRPGHSLIVLDTALNEQI